MKEKIIIPLHYHYKDVFGIVNSFNKCFVTPGWHPVPVGTTREQIVFDASLPMWYPPDADPSKVTKQAEPTPVIETSKQAASTWKVEASKPGKFYDVTFNGTFWKCTCPANSFRRGDCKHIKGIQAEV